MKSLYLVPLTIALIFASCGGKKQQPANETDSASNQPIEIKSVDGRANFVGNEVLITPQPAIMIATYDANQNPDVMMAAWGGQCGVDKIFFSLSAHKTTENIRLNKAFTVSFASANTIAESDYFGIVSANDVPDKVQRAKYTVMQSPNVNAPIVQQYPLTLECTVASMIDDENGGALVIGKIVNMSADQSILNADGKIDIDKLQPVVFDATTRTYRALGEKVGVAWSIGRLFINDVE